MRKFFLRTFDHEQGLNEAAQELCDGISRDKVLVRAVRTLEQDPNDYSVGYGGAPNILGEMELDGAFMDGNSLNFGAVMCIKNCLPVRVAHQLMNEGTHCVLVGNGADQYALEIGFAPEPVLYEPQRREWEERVKPLLGKSDDTRLMNIVRSMTSPDERNFDTTVMIASDGSGLSCASSTSGWDYKYPGRAGDTGVPGAGYYVDSKFGGAACTWTGEMAMRAKVAGCVVGRLESGDNVREAVHYAIGNVRRLRGGALRTLVIHAIDTNGEAYAAAINPIKPISYMYWRDDMAKPERRDAEAINIKFSALS